MEPLEDSVDYPDFAHPVATDVSEGKADYGIVIYGNETELVNGNHNLLSMLYRIVMENCCFNIALTTMPLLDPFVLHPNTTKQPRLLKL
jgi:hypothetical protein